MSAALARNWWAVGLRSLVAVAFAITVILLLPRPTLGALVLLFAAYLAADGALAIVAGVRAMRRGELWQALMFEGALNLMVGGAVLIWPAMAAVAFDRLTSAWAIVTGALLLAAARRLARSHGRWLLVLAGAQRLGARWLRRWVRRPGAHPRRWMVARRLCAAVCNSSSGPRRPAAMAGSQGLHICIGQHVGRGSRCHHVSAAECAPRPIAGRGICRAAQSPAWRSDSCPIQKRSRAPSAEARDCPPQAPRSPPS